MIQRFLALSMLNLCGIAAQFSRSDRPTYSESLHNSGGDAALLWRYMHQKTAVEKALNTESLAIIQGPPETSKTNVITEIIRQILKMNADYPDLPEKKILLVSQSHPAVDKMLDDLLRDSNGRQNLIKVGCNDIIYISINNHSV